MLKRGYVGVYHLMSKKHLSRYVNEFQGRHNQRGMAVLSRMVDVVRRPEGSGSVRRPDRVSGRVMGRRPKRRRGHRSGGQRCLR